ncbi:MAG: acyltransferase family protein [Planctomycetota bacterium]
MDDHQSQTSGKPASSRTGAAAIDSLTGLRFFAALSVIFVHALNQGLSRDAGYEQLAASAVSLFFVLSGFILTYVYDGRLTWAKVPEYLVARWARIWPLHVTCLLLAAALLTSRGNLYWDSGTVWRFIANLFLVQSWIPIKNWPLSFNGPAWSISTELGFYLMFPLLLLAGRNHFRPILLGTAVVSLGGLAGMQYWVANYHPDLWLTASEIVYCHPVIRAIDFVLGMAAGKWFLRHAGTSDTEKTKSTGLTRWCRDTLFELLAVGGLLAVGWAASRSGPLHHWWIDRGLSLMAYWSLRGGALLLPFAFLIWVLAWSKGMLAQFLSQPLIVWLGEISFAFYLVQYSVIRFLDPWVSEGFLPVSVVIAMVITFSLALAILLHLMIELPCRTVFREAVAGNWSKAGRTLWEIPGNLMKSGAAVTAAGLIVIALNAGWFESDQQQYSRKQMFNRWEEAQLGKDYLRIVFDKEATLLSYSVKEAEDKGLELELFWEIHPDHSRGRFLHITDSAGKIIYQPLLQQETFARASPGERITEKILLEAKHIPADGQIGIGFYDRYSGTSPIVGGVLTMNGRRLELVRLQGGKFEAIPQK